MLMRAEEDAELAYAVRDYIHLKRSQTDKVT